MALTVPWSHELDWPSDLKPFDPFDTGIQADPYRHYAWMRANAPFLKAGDPDAPLYMVSRFADVTAGLRDNATFSSAPSDVVVPGLLLSLDQPHHTRLRETVSRAFTPKAIGAKEELVAELVDQHWQRILDAGGGEVIGDFASPLTIGVISSVLGVKVEDAGLIREWTSAALAYLGTLIRNVNNPDATDEAYRNMVDLMSGIMDDVKLSEGDKVINNLARLRDEGSLQREEAAGFAVLLFMAGHETTTILTGNCLDFLADNPGYIDEIAEKDNAGTFLNELIRFRPSVHRLTRYMHQDTEFGGYALPAGASVRFLVASANRDEAKFADGDRFDISRNNAAHAGFGYGVHMCIGSWLAKMEVRSILDRIAATTLTMHRSDRWPRKPMAGGAFATVGLESLGVEVQPR